MYFKVQNSVYYKEMFNDYILDLGNVLLQFFNVLELFLKIGIIIKIRKLNFIDI